MTALMPVTLVSITIDRCWIILAGIVNRKKHLIFSIISIAISIFFGCLVFYSFGSSPPTDTTTNCLGFGCLTTITGYRVFNCYKMVAGACNFIAGIIFVVLWRLQKKSIANKCLLTTVEERRRRNVSLNF